MTAGRHDAFDLEQVRGAAVVVGEERRPGAEGREGLGPGDGRSRTAAASPARPPPDASSSRLTADRRGLRPPVDAACSAAVGCLLVNAVSRM